MAQEQFEVDMASWLRIAEEGCLRIGALRRRLDRDRACVLRKMEMLDSDNMLFESQAWWKAAITRAGSSQQSPRTINVCGPWTIHPLERKSSHPSNHQEDNSLLYIPKKVQR